MHNKNRIMMSYEDIIKSRLLQHECHFTWSLREEDFAVSDLLIRLDEQIDLESGKARETRSYSSLGYVYYLLGEQQKAISYLRKSVELAKKYYKDKSNEVLIVTFGDLAWLHYHTKDFSVCEDYLRQLERIHGTLSKEFNYATPLEVLREKGWAFLKFSRKYYIGARECFRQALEISPNDSDLNTGYAIALYRTTETPDSQESPTIKQLRRAISLDPDDAVLLVLLALRLKDVKSDEKSPENAINFVICALLKSPENPHVIRYAAMFFRQLGTWDKVIHLIEETLQNTPNSAFLHHQLARCYFAKNKIEKTNNKEYNKKYLYKCIYHLEKAVALKPCFIVAMADLALQYGHIGLMSKAKIIFENAFKMAKIKNEDLHVVYWFYGQYQLYCRKSEESAIYNFMQGLRLQPKSSEGKKCELKLITICEDRNKRMQNAHNSKACEIYGFIHEVKGEKRQAAEFYERALTKRLDQGDSLLFAEIRMWLMSFKETDQKSVLKLILDQDSYEEGLVSGGLKTVHGTIDKKIVNLVEIDIIKIKRILQGERQALCPGPHVVILAISLDLGEFTDQTKKILEDLEFLGEKFWNHVIVVFTEVDHSVDKYHRTHERDIQWLLERCGKRYFISGGVSHKAEMGELLKMIQEMIWSNNSMHLLLPEISDGDSRFLPEAQVGTDINTDDFFTPEIIYLKGQRVYRMSCSHAGWFHCKFTKLGFNMKGEGQVLYSTVLQESSSPCPANCYSAGPLYDIKCVKGELCQLKLPHCETSTADLIQSMLVVHYSGDIVEVLKPQNITSTHATVSIPGTSGFRITRFINWFKEKIYGQVMLFYLPPIHRLHVFLQPNNVDPHQVASCVPDYKLIQAPCDCSLIYNSEYSMSCESLERFGPSVKPEIKIQPQNKRFSAIFKERHHYFPTFEISLPVDVMEVRLCLKKKDTEYDKEVWKYDINLKEHATKKLFSPSTEEQYVSFLKKCRCEIIQRVVNIDPILDGFADVIHLELFNQIRSMTTPQDKTRAIYNILDVTPAYKQRFYTLLMQNEPHLLKDLQPNQSTGSFS